MERKAVKQRFKGKVAIVTGGSTGIGFSIVEELCREGAYVSFTGRSDIGHETKKNLTMLDTALFLFRET